MSYRKESKPITRYKLNVEMVLGQEFFHRDLELDFIPSRGMILELIVGSITFPFEVELIKWNEDEEQLCVELADPGKADHEQLTKEVSGDDSWG